MHVYTENEVKRVVKKKSYIMLGWIVVEVVLYPRFPNFTLDEYAFFWAAILVFSFLLKIFNVEPNPGPLGVGDDSSDAYSHLAMSFMERHVKSKYRKVISTADEDRRIIVAYVILIAVNCAIVYFAG